MTIFNRDPLLISVAEVKQSTLKQNIKDLDDDDIKVLINKSEDNIKDYLGYDIRKYYNNLVDDDKYDFKKACLYWVEQVYANWDNIKTSVDWVVILEKTWDRQVGYSTDIDNKEKIGINPIMEEILLSWKKNFYRLDI